MFLFLPLMLILYCICCKENKSLPLICLGVVAAAIVCAVRMIFFYPHRIVTYSFMDNFIYILLKENLLPAFILYVCFLIFSKDSAEYKSKAIFPLEIAFYSIYLPYIMVNCSAGYREPFSALVKPILYVAMFGAVGILASNSCKMIKTRHGIWLAIIYILLIPVFLAGPAYIESKYLMENKLLSAVSFTALYAAFPFIYAIVKQIVKLFKKDGSPAIVYNSSGVPVGISSSSEKLITENKSLSDMEDSEKTDYSFDFKKFD